MIYDMDIPGLEGRGKGFHQGLFDRISPLQQTVLDQNGPKVWPSKYIRPCHIQQSDAGFPFSPISGKNQK